MERVAFLVDGTGERIDCLLNPETVETRRLAGVRGRGTAAGQLVGAGQRDDPLHFTGGGRTELLLDLLFDVELLDGPAPERDVRALTGRLWTLAENSAADGDRPPQVRLVWGKGWNVPGVIAAVAERFDQFAADGLPRRSWLRLKLLRTAEPGSSAPPSFDERLADPGPAPTSVDPATGAVQAIGEARFDLLATQAGGSPLDWRELAERNGIDNPFDVPAGTVLAVPRRPA